MDSIISNFWWGQRENEGRIQWRSWKSLTKSKHSGGLGFKDFSNFNLALLAKLGWRILKNPEALWVRIIKAIYFPETDFLHASKGPKTSWAWHSILSGRELLKKGIC